jgi:hypothetical protein
MNEVGKKSNFQEVLHCFEPMFSIFFIELENKTCDIVWGIMHNMKKSHSSERILRLITYTMCWRIKFKVGGPINTFGEIQITWNQCQITLQNITICKHIVKYLFVIIYFTYIIMISQKNWQKRCDMTINWNGLIKII